MSDESSETKLVRLDERLNNALVRILDIQRDSQRDCEQVRRENQRDCEQLRADFVESYRQLKSEMDKRFETSDKKITDLTDEFRGFSGDVTKKLGDIALQLQALSSNVQVKEESVKFGWKVLTIIASVATGLGGVVGFILTHTPIGK